MTCEIKFAKQGLSSRVRADIKEWTATCLEFNFKLEFKIFLLIWGMGESNLDFEKSTFIKPRLFITLDI